MKIAKRIYCVFFKFYTFYATCNYCFLLQRINNFRIYAYEL